MAAAAAAGALAVSARDQPGPPVAAVASATIEKKTYEPRQNRNENKRGQRTSVDGEQIAD